MSADNQDKPSNAQSALLDYYDDVLGSISYDPLKERAKEECEVKMQPERVEESKSAPQGLSATKTKYAIKPKSVEPQKKMKITKPSPAFYDESYELKRKTDIVAPLIIPAAFPKLAPKTNLTPKTRTKPKINTEVPPAFEKNVVSEPVAVKSKLVSEEVATKPAIEAYVGVINQPSSIKQKELPAAKEEPPSIENVSALGVPVWAQERFECLLFTVAGLKLAVPLISLGAIYKIESHFTPLVGRASWFMGLYRHDGRNVRVVDTAQLVMPDRVSDTTRKNYRYIIRLGGNNWGVACDAVQESIQLQPEEVKWRTERSKRGWLSGTVIEHMCALIDVEALTDILKKEALIKHSAYKG